jgi:DNA-binding transcriptional LysR family regulator
VQSGISSSIAGLERELGVSLFARSKHHIELTPSGRALLVEARRALAAVTAARAAAVAANESLTGVLNIGIARAIPRRIQLARILHEFHVANPGVTLTVNESLAPAFDDLRTGTIDLAIGPGHGPTGVTSMALTECWILLACAKLHPLARRRSVSLRSLEGERFVDFPNRWTTSVLVERAFADAGMEHVSAFEVNTLALMLQLVEEGTAVALVPDMLAEMTSNVAFVPVRPTIGPWELTVSFLGAQPKNAPATAFLQMLLAGPMERGRESYTTPRLVPGAAGLLHRVPSVRI